MRPLSIISDVAGAPGFPVPSINVKFFRTLTSPCTAPAKHNAIVSKWRSTVCFPQRKHGTVPPLFATNALAHGGRITTTAACEVHIDTDSNCMEMDSTTQASRRMRGHANETNLKLTLAGSTCALLTLPRPSRWPQGTESPNTSTARSSCSNKASPSIIPARIRAPREVSSRAKDAQTYADYISYDMEHAPFDVKGLAEYMRGLVAGGPTKSGHRTPAVIVNVPVNGLDGASVRANAWMFQPVLATGVHGILLCHADSPDAARAFVEAVRFPIHKQGLDRALTKGAAASTGLRRRRRSGASRASNT